MSYESVRESILANPILASDGDHTARLWRIAENVHDGLRADDGDDRLLHLMSRVGEFCRGLGKDLQSGHTSAEQAALLMGQLAEIGKLSFDEWLRRH